MARNLIVAFFLIGLNLISESGIAEEAQELYKLHSGDSVTVSVWREDKLRTQAIILPDGSISLPLVGRIEMAGLSTIDAEKRITEKLKDYLPSPVVSVVISGIDGNRAYVIGKVLHPGPVVINGPMTVLQAISMVGGFEKFADQDGIRVVRTKAEGQEVMSVSYDDIVSGKDMSTNIKLQAGDTIVVP